MLQMLFEASASGLLRSLQTNPFDLNDVLHLRHVLHRLRSERYLRYSTRELMTALVKQICMAIGNRDRYRSAHDDVTRLLGYLRELDIPNNETCQPAKNEYDALIELWCRVFGDPEEMERKQIARDTVVECGETEEARLFRKRQEYVHDKFLRR